jgi:hypothetical protein
MRSAVVFGALVIIAAPAAAQKKDPPPTARFGVDADLEAYPQDSAKAALASVIKAIDGRQYIYLAAQLADPDEVDKKVQALDGKFDRYVKVLADHLSDNPETVRQLRRFASEGAYSVNGDAATVSLKEIKGRQVFLRKVSGRWYLLDQQKASKENP